jgi:hypothetical protein
MHKNQILFQRRSEKTDRVLTSVIAFWSCARRLRGEKEATQVGSCVSEGVGYSHGKQKIKSGLFATDLTSVVRESTECAEKT